LHERNEEEEREESEEKRGERREKREVDSNFENGPRKNLEGISLSLSLSHALLSLVLSHSLPLYSLFSLSSNFLSLSLKCRPVASSVDDKRG